MDESADTEPLPPPRTLPGDPAPDADRRGAADFDAGHILAGRYRIVSLLGRGGMGEVYRADDLSLGQSVALKFLPASLSADPVRLEHLRQEVRVARQISHPNVCRVYDIGEAGGRHFVAMEFVDGEDLSGLIRRIGRLPGEKAVQLGRQICAGLAAVHDRGVVHRDLKPANVMIDGRGQARIMDFGVAAATEDLASGGAIRAGTPAYMAPEQFEGREVTPRSDVYALGLVLYEIFTGRPAHAVESEADLRAIHRSSAPPTDPSEHVADIDPAAERAIIRCLEADPGERPSNAIAVMAALPGGDPLQALMEAGETPSPELVAASGRAGTLPVWAATALAAITIASMMIAIMALAPLSFGTLGQGMLGPAVLEHRARELVVDLGATGEVVDEASGYGLWLLEGERPANLAELEARFADPVLGPRYFWYRSHLAPMLPLKHTIPGGGLGERVERADPPMDELGMRRVLLGPRGGLLEFDRVTAEIDVPGAGSDADADDAGDDWWLPVLEATDLPGHAFAEVEPLVRPRNGWDERRAWIATPEDGGGPTIRVEAAALAGTVSSVRVLGQSEAGVPRARPAEWVPGSILAKVFAAVGYLVGGVLAYRNLRAGRGDRRGAIRLGILFFALSMGGWAMTTSRVPSLDVQLPLLLSGMAYGLSRTLLACLLYLGIEPHVRRAAPVLLIGWSRLLAGRWRDPIVGRELLLGAAIGTCTSAVTALALRALDPAALVTPGAIAQVEPFLNLFARTPIIATGTAFTGLAIYVVILLAVRGRPRTAVSVFVSLIALINVGVGGVPTSAVAVVGLVVSIAGSVVVVTRLGVVAAVMYFAITSLLRIAPITVDPGVWYAPATGAGLVVLGALVLHGWFASTAGRRGTSGGRALAP